MPETPAAKDQSRNHPYFGRTIARCKVGERVGAGRTSHVFKAYYEPLEKNIAIKILSGDMADFQAIKESFLLEARAIAKLDHENLVRVFDVVESEGLTCILMEFVPGRTLQEEMKKRGALPVKKALRIAGEMARGLAHAHSSKVVHRDVKPANVILTKGSGQVKLVDFGLAGPKTLANRAGTPMYMSPEACQGKRIDEKSDVYALGVCLYQMLTGTLPFGGKSVKEILDGHMNVEPAPASVAKPDLGDEYDSVLKKLLVKAKGYRPSAQETVKLLAPFLSDAPAAAEDRKGRRRGRVGGARAAQEKSHAVPIIVAVCSVVVLALVAFVATRAGGDKGGETAQTSNGGTQGTTQPTTSPIAPPPVVPEKTDAEKAYEEVERFTRQYPTDFDAQRDRWDEMAKKHPGTEWADKAMKRRQEAADAKIRAEQEKEQAARRAEADKKRREQRQVILDAVAVFDFAHAGNVAKNHGALSGEDMAAWRKRNRRLGYLGENFLERIDQGIKDRGRPLKASKVDPTQADVRDLTGADEKGLHWSDGSLTGVITWKSLKGKNDPVFFDLVKKLVSSTKAEDHLFMAILAAEIWHEEGEAHKKCKESLEMVGLTDDSGVVSRTLKDYFLNVPTR